MKMPFNLKLAHCIPLLLMFVWLSGCSRDPEPLPAQQLEYLVGSERIALVSAQEVRERYPLASGLVNSGVVAYKITYRTAFPQDNGIIASGLVLVPGVWQGELTLLSFQHGTITQQQEAPSAYQPAGNMEAYIAGTLGASLAKGYMVVMPDYIGYGESSDIQHPYQEKASLASACLDMLYATKELAGQLDINIKKEVRLIGYSEGGYATMALHQAIQETAAGDFSVEASYPGAGAYDMVGTAQWMVNQARDLSPPATSFYLWTLIAYNQLYGINAPLTDMLQPPYAEAVATAIARGTMAAEISNNPTELFTSGFIRGIRDESNTAFIAALQNNNIYDWRPSAPVLLFHAEDDDIVPLLNAMNAVETMTANGAQVQFVSLGNIGHGAGASRYIEALLPQLLQ